jgi:polar amino acid transport system substrate-binding protein
MKRWGLLMAGLLLATAARAQANNLVLAVDGGTEMPMARIVQDRVVDGMSLELGRLLARQLGLELQMVALPRKRLRDELLQGRVDGACAYLPEWLPGPLQWSKPFFLQEYAIVSRADAPAPANLEALRGQRLGTVLGFVYPELEAALGGGFVRDDAPDAAASLRKLAADRLQHVAVSQRLLGYLRRSGQFSAAVHPPLAVGEMRTQCALAPGAKVSVQQLNQAIDTIERNGSLAALYRRYDYVTDSSTRSNSRP